MEKKVFKNYIYNVIYQIITIILPIITAPYVSRVLGAEKIGIFGYTLSIVTYFTLVSAFGMTKYGQREIAYVQGDREKQSKIFWELCTIKLISVIFFALLFFLVFCISGEYVIYYRILLFEIIAVFFDITWFFQGLEDFKKVVIRNTIVKLISIACIFLFVKTQQDLFKYFLIYVVSTCAGNLTLWLNIHKYVDKVKVKFRDLKKHLLPMLSLFIPQVAVSIYTVLDKTMLGKLVNDMAEVGYYTQSQRIVKIALTLVTTLSIVMMPRISSVFSKNDKKKIKEYMDLSFRFNWFMGTVIAFGIAAISPTFVPWFFGAGYDKVIDLLIYTSPVIVFISFSTTIGSQYLISIKKQNVQTVAVVSGAIINVILNFILIPHLKSTGAIIATLAAELSISLIEICYVVSRKHVELSSVISKFYNYLFSGIIMFVIIRLMQRIMSVSVAATFVQIVVGTIVYVGILAILHDKFLFDIFKTVFKKEGRK